MVMDINAATYYVESREGSRRNSMMSPAESGANTPMHSSGSSGTATPNEHSAAQAHKNKKGLWKSLKHAVVEHHRSVNAAYAAAYGQGLNVARHN